MNPEIPYNDLPLLPPIADCETAPILKQLVRTTRALAEFKGTAELIPAQSILLDILPISEAKASSEIENILTTNDKVYHALASDSKYIDTSTKEVLRYKEALWDGYHNLKETNRITVKLLTKTVQTITGDMTGIRKTAGTKVENAATHKVIYTPPEGEDIIKDKLYNLEKFINSKGTMDPLIKMAVMHYQFEAIHPFPDGNGRTGRILNILYLVKEDLLKLPVLYLSKYIIEHKAEYYQRLQDVTIKGNWEAWIIFILKAVEHTSEYSKTRITGIQNLLNQTLVMCKEKLPPNVYSKELIELIFRQPYTTISKLVNAGIAERKTAAKYLYKLENIGVMRSKPIGKETIFINIGLYDYLSKS